MRAGWVGNYRLQRAVLDGTARIVPEVVQIEDEHVKVTQAQWQAAATTGSILELDHGGATLGSSSAGTITHTPAGDGTVLDDLSATPPWDALLITWTGSGAENQELETLVVNLDPRADGGSPKTVDRFVCILYRVVKGGNPGSDTELVRLTRPISVDAAGESPDDFTFDFRTFDRAPTVGQAPEGGSRPQTLIRIYALTASGAQADNVSWTAVADADGTLTGSGHRVTHHQVQQSLGPGTQGGSVYLLSTVQTGMPLFTLNRAGYSVGTVDFTGVNAVPDLTGSGDLVIVARGMRPSDSDFSIVIDDGVSGDVACVDGDIIGQDNTAAGGSDLSGVSTTGPWDMLVTLTPSTDGFRAPTIVEMGVERTVSSFLHGVATLSGGSRQVDPQTLKANIAEASLHVAKTGEADYLDYGANILAGNHIGDVHVRIWIGAESLDRRYWMLDSVWDVQDFENGSAAHVLQLLSPTRRLRFPIPRFVATSGNDGTREPLVYADDILAVFSDLLDSQAGLPDRLIGPGCTDATTQIARTINEADLKDVVDSVAYLEGRTVTESQGRIKALTVMRDDAGADVPVVYFPLGSYDPVSIGPGFSARTDEVFVRYNWNAETEAYEDERRYLNAAALLNLGGVGLNTTHQVGDDVAKWITTEALADSVGRRIVNHFFSGLIRWRIRSAYAHPELEIGDVVSITTDQFVGRNPITEEEIRGPLSALAIVVQVADTWGTQLDLWVPGYEYIVVGEGTTTRSGFATAQVTGVEITFDSSGNAVVSVAADAGTQNIYITVGDGVAPADPTSGSNDGTIVGRTGTVATSVQVTSGNAALVKAVAENVFGGVGPVQEARQDFVVATESLTGANPTFTGVLSVEGGDGGERVRLDADLGVGGRIRLFDDSDAEVGAWTYAGLGQVNLRSEGELQLQSRQGGGSGNVSVTGGNLEVLNDIEAGDIVARADSAFDIGATATRFREIFADILNGTAVHVGAGAAGSPPSGQARIYWDDTNNVLKVLESDGTVHTLAYS